ncbi:Hypothetical protein CINCED_3A020838 [Cinara cedri]|uniref:Uncharacterized protein n=1 Tax=Cinara cedri TaxID=506608 RepID=A0A5E4N9S1_9HEMI|nr:Hypothetical protein CINCED_3A020838 [Cinara cedri]
MIAATKSFALAPVALILVVATTTALAASVGQPLTVADADVEQTETVRSPRNITPKTKVACVFADVYKTGLKTLVCGDSSPPTVLAKSSNAAASPPAPAPPLQRSPQPPQPQATEQTNKPAAPQGRTFLNLDCLKKPDPVNVYVQPQQQIVPQQHYAQPQYAQPQYVHPQIHVETPQVHYVQPQIHVETPQLHYVQPQIHVEQPLVHYVQQSAPQVQYQPVVCQRPPCQPAEQFPTSYGGGGYYGRSVEYLDYLPAPMKSAETSELVQPAEDVLQQTAYAPAALYRDPEIQYGSGPAMAAVAYNDDMLAASRKGFGGSRMTQFPMMRPTPLFRPVFRTTDDELQYFDAPVPAPTVPITMMRMSDDQLYAPQQYGQYSYIIQPVPRQQKLFDGMTRTAEVQGQQQGQQQQTAPDYSVPESAASDQVAAAGQDVFKNAQQGSTENQQPAVDAQSNDSADPQTDVKSPSADQKKANGNKTLRN